MTLEFETHNDLPADTRSSMVQALNRVLASGLDLALKAKHAHWNVKGPQFIALHELFDRVYADASGWNDMIAERAVVLGGVADGRIATVAKETTLKPYDPSSTMGPEHVKQIAAALGQFGKELRSSITLAEKAKDPGTADLFTEVLRGTDKSLWFVEAHIQGEAKRK